MTGSSGRRRKFISSLVDTLNIIRSLRILYFLIYPLSKNVTNNNFLLIDLFSQEIHLKCLQLALFF